MPDGNTGTPFIVSGEIDVLAGPGSPGDPERDYPRRERAVGRGQGLDPDSGCSQMALVARPGVRLTKGGVRTVSPRQAVAALEYFTERTLAAEGIALSQLDVQHIPTTVHAEALSRRSIDLVAEHRAGGVATGRRREPDGARRA